MAKIDDTLFEDVPYSETPLVSPKESSNESTPQMDDSLFEDIAHPESQRSLASIAEEQQPSTSAPKVSAGRALLVGSGQGATFGFGDELTAPFMAAAEISDAPTLPGESTWEKYKRLMQLSRDVAREEQKAAQEQQPGAYTTGVVGGGLLAPGLGAAKMISGASKIAQAANLGKAATLATKIGTGAVTGAGIGALSGAGEAEGSLEERLPAIEEGAKIGAIGGAALPIAAQAAKTVGKGIKAASEIPVVQDVTKAFSRGLSKGENLVSVKGRQEAADLVREQGSNFFDDLKALQRQAGEVVNKEIKTAEDLGQTVDLTNKVNDVLEKLRIIQQEGSTDAARYAAEMEREIRRITGFQQKALGSDLVGMNAPEGLIIPRLDSQPAQITPTKAQELKQALNAFLPKKGMSPLERRPAELAGELYQETGTQMNTLSEGLAKANEEYGLIKDTIKRLGVKEKGKLPSEIQDQLYRILSQSEKQNMTGDQLRNRMTEVMDNLKNLAPELVDTYKPIFSDMLERLDLANKTIRGGQTQGLIGTTRAVATSAANLAGLGLREAAGAVGLSGEKLASSGQKTGSILKNLVTGPASDKATMAYQTRGTGAIEKIQGAMEPYQMQRKVASVAENAEPETLKNQAQQIRDQYGNQGEKLAQILDNMSTKNKEARRALMFTILQNHVYRQMLGLKDESQKE